ncbi:MAG: serine hydrolase domain-containing protein, partial [Acidimicrobiales bacterium]
WRLGLAPAELRGRFTGEPLLAPPGRAVEYSDLGFLVLGWLAEAVTGETLDALVARWVSQPLGLISTGFGPRQERDVAATEAGPDGRYRAGVVHDENAAALGYPVGHAGLFSTAADLAAYLGAWTAASDDWLPGGLRGEATRDRTAGLGGHRGLGWTARHDAYDQLGDAWPESAVFHSGFTGTSLALDPPSRRWVVLLTNDIQLGRQRGVINPLRWAVHTALAP